MILVNRVIPVLLLRQRGLVKTVKFKDPKYLGDPINAVKIFNEKDVDELIFLDITSTNEKRPPPFSLIADIASECFMPFAYGGGITSLEHVQTIINLGVEKVVINSRAVEDLGFIRRASELIGSQSVVVSIDAKRSLLGKYEVHIHSGRTNAKFDPVEFAKRVEGAGAGEIFINSIDRDGTMKGYDIDLIQRVSHAVGIPVVACGGAGRVEDFAEAVQKGGASAAAAGSFFVFQGKHRAFLISYPSPLDLQRAFSGPSSLNPQLTQANQGNY